jgi:chromosome segregation ATPase
MASVQQDALPQSDVMRPPVATRAGTKNPRRGRSATSSAQGKTTRSRSTVAGAGRKAAGTTAGESLDRAQHALDQAAKTEKRLRASLKKHSEAVSAVKDDLAKRSRDLKDMESQLKVAKKSRKQAARKLSEVPRQTTATK